MIDALGTRSLGACCARTNGKVFLRFAIVQNIEKEKAGISHSWFDDVVRFIYY